MLSNNIQYPEGCEPIDVSNTNTELLKRLKILGEALKQNWKTNDETTTGGDDRNRYADLMLHLTQDEFLTIKNRDIRLLLACCIADLFRIFAPNSPIDDLTRLKDVLLFLTTVIGNAVDKDDPMYQYYLYLIENLSLVETMQLALRLGDDAYVILRHLIKQSFGSINEKNADEHIQGMLLGMCSKLIQGIDQISNIILDAIFYFIVQPQKINNREAYRMARDLIRTNQTALEPCVSLFLKRGVETGVLDECELISHKKLYDLICELHKFAPELIISALPPLIDLLRGENVTARRETTRLFGNLFGDSNSRLSEDEPEVWAEYMKRFADVNEEIRRICIRDAEDILVFHPELRGQVTDAVILRCQDVDENVRLEVITMVQSLTKRKFEALSERLLIHVIERTRDRKVKVRHAAIRGLSQLHRAVFSNDELTNLERSSVLNIFSSIINHYYQPIPEDKLKEKDFRLLTEKLFVSNLIPYKLEEDKRMGILITVFLNLNNSGMKAFEKILMKQSFQRRLLCDLVKFIEQSAEPEKGRTIDDVIKRIIECSYEPAKFSLQFRQFMEHLKSDQQLLSLLKYVTGSEYTCRKVELTVFEILQRLRSLKVSTECMDALRSLFERCLPLQFDGNAVSVLIDKTVTMIKSNADDNQATTDRCNKLLKLLRIVASAYPHCFITGPTLHSLVEMIEMENCFLQIENLLGLVIVLSGELKQHKLLADDMVTKYVKHCERISLEGTPRAAKYAVRCISSLLDVDQARIKLTAVLQNSVSHVSASDPLCCTALKALSSCVEVDAAEFCNDLFELLKTKIMHLLLDQESDTEISICKNRKTNLVCDSSRNDIETFDNETICDGNYVAVKKHCLKFVAKFLVSVAQFTECDVEPVAKNLFKLYTTLIETKGDIFEKKCCRKDMAEIRLVAGSSMLKLATKSRYEKFITARDFVTLSTLGYDEDPGVRWQFFMKLNKHLMALHLHIEYLGLFSLVVLNEDTDFRNRIRGLVDANITRRRKYLEIPEVKKVEGYYQPEYCLAYAIYALSKLPSFESTKCEPELHRLAECIWFLLEIFNSRKEPGSLELIFNIFKAVKNCTSRLDGTKEETLQSNEKIWALCDIGILLMSYRVKNLMKNVESKPLLSKRFFLYMGRANSKVYVPVSFVEEMRTKKVNTKNAHTDTTETTTKASLTKISLKSMVGSSGSKSGILEVTPTTTATSATTVTRKRKITAKQPVRSKRNVKVPVQDEDTNDNNGDNGDKNENVGAGSKRLKRIAEEQKPQQAIAKRKTDKAKPATKEAKSPISGNGGSSSSTADLQEEFKAPVKKTKKASQKRLAPLRSLNNSQEPGPSKMPSPNKGDSRSANGSLEDCDFSPICPVNGRSTTKLVKSVVTNQILPFVSSTPISKAKKRPTTTAAATTNENRDTRHEVENDDAKTVANKKSAKGDKMKTASKVKSSSKVKKLCAARNVKITDAEAHAQTAETGGIASRLRSRRPATVASSSKQPVTVKSPKK